MAFQASSCFTQVLIVIIDISQAPHFNFCLSPTENSQIEVHFGCAQKPGVKALQVRLADKQSIASPRQNALAPVFAKPDQ
jgi:hypothetical protein